MPGGLGPILPWGTPLSSAFVPCSQANQGPRRLCGLLQGGSPLGWRTAGWRHKHPTPEGAQWEGQKAPVSLQLLKSQAPNSPAGMARGSPLSPESTQTSLLLPLLPKHSREPPLSCPPLQAARPP